MAPGGDSHSTKGEYDSKGLSKPSLSCYRGGACKMSALDSGPGETLSRSVQRKNWHRILLIFQVRNAWQARSPRARSATGQNGIRRMSGEQEIIANR
jgi:hypothetical protein